MKAVAPVSLPAGSFSSWIACLAALPAALAPVACCASAAADLPARAPNVLFVVFDDLKPAFGIYGDPQARTPHLDALAARGTAFAAAYCQQPVCAASRNSVLTGLRPDSIGIYTLRDHFRAGHQPDVVTLPQFFRDHGYHTESIGKVYHTAHGNYDDARSWSVPARRYDGTPQPTAPGAVPRWDPSAPRNPAYAAPDVADEDLEDGRIATLAIEALQRLARDERPFFLAVGFVKPHLPFEAPRRYWDLFSRDRFDLDPRTAPPAGSPPYAHQDFGELRLYAGIPREGPLDPELARTLIHGYYASAAYADAQFGRVMAELDRLGLADNTIVVAWGDHGFHLSDLGLWCKGDNYEQAVRSPLVVSAPTQRYRGGVARGLVELVDIYPTVVELAGMPLPAHLEGDSLVPLLDDPAHPGKPAVFHLWPKLERNVVPRGMGRAVRTAQHRLVVWDVEPVLGEPAVELYDYADAEAAEVRNLADDPAYAQVRTELEAWLARDWPSARLPR